MGENQVTMSWARVPPPTTSQDYINRLPIGAANAARSIPNLRFMEIWGENKTDSFVLHYTCYN